MKVVYNTCYGGFSLSAEAVRFMADRGNKECIELVRWHEENGGCLEWAMYDECCTPRHDAILVIAVETLGSGRASGDCAELSVHELKGNRYKNDEYDGVEYVIEPKDINWIEV